MAITITCASIKGGCSKTTTTINLAAALAEKGYKCLVVDFDPQANASMALGIAVEELDTTIADVLMPLKGVKSQLPIEKVILKTDFANLDIAPAGLHLSLAQMYLVNAVGRESLLRKELSKNEIQINYDFIIIDTAPSVGILLLNAFGASDYVIGCSTCERFSIKGIDLMLEQYKQIKDNGINKDLKFLGVIAAKSNRSNHAKESFDTLKNNYTILGCTRTSTKANEATSEGVPVVYTSKNNPVSQEYKRIADHLINEYEQGNLTSQYNQATIF